MLSSLVKLLFGHKLWIAGNINGSNTEYQIKSFSLSYLMKNAVLTYVLSLYVDLIHKTIGTLNLRFLIDVEVNGINDFYFILYKASFIYLNGTISLSSFSFFYYYLTTLGTLDIFNIIKNMSYK